MTAPAVLKNEVVHGLAALPDGSFPAVRADSRTGVFQLWTDRLQIEGR